MRCWSTNGPDGAGIVEVAGGGRGGVVVGSGVAEALAVVSTAERSDVGVVHGREAMWA